MSEIHWHADIVDLSPFTKTDTGPPEHPFANCTSRHVLGFEQVSDLLCKKYGLDPSYRKYDVPSKIGGEFRLK